MDQGLAAFDVLIPFTNGYYLHMGYFALPLFFISFILDIYYGYGTKSMPSFSPFVVTFQLKFALIFVFLIFGMEMLTEAFTEYFITKFQ